MESEGSVSSDSNEYEYKNGKNDLRKFELEMNGFTTRSRFERNLVHGLLSNRIIQDEASAPLEEITASHFTERGLTDISK